VAVHFGVQPLQQVDVAEPGIARYVGDLADALCQWHPDQVSDLVFDPLLPCRGRLEQYLGRDALRSSADLHLGQGDVYHVSFPLGNPELERLWPRSIRRSGCQLVVTLYDLIPLLEPDQYLGTAADKRRYAMWLRVVQMADRVHVLSEATGRDAAEHLKLRPGRIEVVGAGVSPMFVPAVDRSAALASLRTGLPVIRPGFLLCPGGSERRKNLGYLLVAYASLPASVRSEHQLVVVGHLGAAAEARLRREVEWLGLQPDVVLTGSVSDAQLVRLYQTTHLFVFPSLLEGFGLGLAEAIACGAPAICAGTSALPEILPDARAHFDPTDPASIHRALERALMDLEHLTRLRSATLHPRHRWRAVAERTARSYETLGSSRRSRRSRRRRLALVSPLPPTPSGIADHSSRLAAALAHWIDVTVLVDESANVIPPHGVDVELVSDLDKVEAAAGPFDSVICAVGNQTFHISAIQLLQKRRCTALLHDVRLDGLWAWSAVHRPDFAPVGFHARLQAQYGSLVPPDLGARGWLERDEAERWGIWMIGDVVRSAEAVYCHSQFAADVARMDAGPDSFTPVRVLPFAHPPVLQPLGVGPSTPPLVASFGVVTAVKALDLMLAAMFELGHADPDLCFALVGPVSDDVREICLDRARQAGLADRLEVAGRVSATDYSTWLRRATVALQLRSATGGESSAAIADCLAAGVPTIVTNVGAQAELDDGCVEKTDRWIDAAGLATTTRRLLDDPGRRAKMGAAAQAYARERAFAKVAGEIYHQVASRRD
jgi:glycosyltransferase involved in cell wall biosynthesis